MSRQAPEDAPDERDADGIRLWHLQLRPKIEELPVDEKAKELRLCWGQFSNTVVLISMVADKRPEYVERLAEQLMEELASKGTSDTPASACTPG